ncbi:MAG: S8 family peptidase [Verrucomicrobiota bacterium]
MREVERRQHSEFLRGQLEAIRAEVTELRGDNIEATPIPELERILVFETEPGHPISADQAYSLCTGSRIEVIQLHQFADATGRKITRVLLHVPFGDLLALSEKIRRYGEGLTEEGNAPNPWVANLSRIGTAALEDMWTDKEPLPADDIPHWWQLWVRRHPPVNEYAFRARRQIAGIEIAAQELKLPDHLVFIARCTRQALESSFGLLTTLAEVRLARPTHIELSHLSAEEQHEFLAESVERIEPPREDAPAVCILDTGIHCGHRLLEPVLREEDNHTIFGDGDASDCYEGSGHGTLMAGLAAYGDLRELVLDTNGFQATHWLEGVKLYNSPDGHADPERPPVHGSFTMQATSTVEIQKPHRPRVYALAITASGEDVGRPSAWSAAIDQLAYGEESGRANQRLFIISAGNIVPSDYGTGFRYPEHNHRTPIEDPAQAWNAITVGAITHHHVVLETDPESAALKVFARPGGLSPFSRTSIDWDDHWPIKPDIVLEGGNCATGARNEPETRDSLVPLSTSKSFRQRPISPFTATSAATALAARLAAGIRGTYPDLWPETIRALMIHSARWNDTMLGGIDPHRGYTREDRAAFRTMLRTYGYGEPDAFRARFSSEQEVTLFREDSLTPYQGGPGSATISDCHVHELKLPSAFLSELLDTPCILRVTLSSFTAPNPSASNHTSGSRYRYGGCLLRFRVRHPEQSVEEFIATVAKSANEVEQSDEEQDPEGEPLAVPRPDSRSWALGPKLRDKGGSLIHDVWSGSAAELAQMDRIAIYPVKGWWATRNFSIGSPWHNCHLRALRYSLIVSIEVAADVPLYTEISNLISVPLGLS